VDYERDERSGESPESEWNFDEESSI